MKKLCFLVLSVLLFCCAFGALAEPLWSEEVLIAYFSECSIEELHHLMSLIESELELRDDSMAQTAIYVLNTNTRKFHLPSCSSINKMKEKNKAVYEGTRDELLERNFEPCRNCNP